MNCENCQLLKISHPNERVESHVRRGSRHINFEEAMAKFIKHMQGTCGKITKTVIFPTDN